MLHQMGPADSILEWLTCEPRQGRELSKVLGSIPINGETEIDDGFEDNLLFEITTGSEVLVCKAANITRLEGWVRILEKHVRALQDPDESDEEDEEDDFSADLSSFYLDTLGTEKLSLIDNTDNVEIILSNSRELMRLGEILKEEIVERGRSVAH